MNAKIKRLILKHPNLIGTSLKIYNFFNYQNLRIKSGNQLLYKVAMLKGVKYDINGKGNTIIIEDYSKLINCKISIFGDNNVVHIGSQCTVKNAEFYMDGNGNKISIGEHTHISGKTHLATVESTKIVIGKNCLFSREIHFRTGDSHTITNLQGERINPSEDIIIGDHCWIGYGVTCLKGVELANNTIVGATSTLTRKFGQQNCIIAGVPAKIRRTEVDWCV